MNFSGANSDNLMDNLPEAILLTDIEGKVLEANDKACKLLNHEKNDLLGLKVEELTSEDGPPLSFEQNVEKGKEGEFSKVINIDKKDEKASLEIKGSKTEIEGQERVLVSIRDITERKITVSEQGPIEPVRETKSHDYYFEKLGDAVFITKVGGEDSGRILDVNTAAVEQTGYRREELIGMNIGKDLSIEAPEMGYEELEEKLSHDETFTFTEKKRKKDGTEYWTEVMVSLIDYKGKKASLSINRDITNSKEMEKRLKRSEEKFRSYVENAPLGVFIADEQGNYLEVNEAGCEMLGYSREEMLDMSIQDIVPPEAMDSTIEAVKQLQNEGEIRYDTPFLKKDGTKGYMVVNAVELSGKRMLAFTLDITKQKEAEEELNQSEKKFRSYWENAPVGSFLLDEDGYFLRVNPEVTELTGYSREELPGMRFTEVVAPEALDSAMKAFEKLLDGGEVQIETTLLRKDGTKGDMVVKAVEVSEDRYLAFTLDVTKRREAERKLEQSNERLEAAMESGDLAWWRMELPSGKVSFSDLKAEMLGYSPERFDHYEDFTELLHPEDYDRAMNAMRSHLEGEEEKYEVEYRIRKKNGDYKWFRDVGSLAKEEGERRSVTGVVMDIDERKEAELALNEERSKLKRLHDAVDQFQQCESEDELFSVAVQATKNILEFDYCIFYRTEDDKLVPIAVTEDMELEDLIPLQRDEGLAGKSFQDRKSILGDNLQQEDRAISNRSAIKGYLSVPIGDIGVFQAGTAEIGAFDEADLELAEILAGHLNEEVKRIELEEKLKQQAIRDPLTGLFNRRYFNETLKKEAQESKRYNKPLAFLMIDVNKFKEINDQYSHQTGDKILEEVASLLKENFRDADTVVRYGGDEFLVMMPETRDKVANAVERLEQELERWNNQSDLLDFPLVLAIGVSHWSPDQERSVEEALKDADKKMYEDKEKKN